MSSKDVEIEIDLDVIKRVARTVKVRWNSTVEEVVDEVFKKLQNEKWYRIKNA